MREVEKKQKKSLEELIPSDLISVSPDSGVSGTDYFTAQYVLDNGNENLRFLKEAQEDTSAGAKKWKITVRVGDNGAPFTSFNLNDQVKFQVPPNTKADQTIQVNFEISNGLDTFSTKRPITALKSPDFDISKSAVSDKLTAGTVSSNDLASASSMVNAILKDKGNVDASAQAKLDNVDGPCTTTEATPCTGHGTCVAGITQAFICKCNTGFAGKLCNVDSAEQAKVDAIAQQVMNAALNVAPSADNLDSLISSFSNIASSTSLPPTMAASSLNKLADMGKLVTDQKTLEDTFKAITSTSNAMSSSSGLRNLATAAEIKNSQKAAINAY